MAITPTWTSPIEYTTGQLVTAANMNAMQNNIQFLHTYGVRKAANGTAGRVPYWADANEITDSANLSFNGTQLAIGGAHGSSSQLYLSNASGQASFDLHNRVTGGTPATGARWRLFADNVGGGGGNYTFGFYDVPNLRIAMGLTNDGALGVAALPLTAGPAIMMPLRARQGGNASNWATAGTATYNSPDAIVQVGVGTITVGNGASLALNLTFPTAFAGTPVFNYSVYGITIGVTHSITAITASSASVNIINNSGGSLSFNIHWMAIGPRV